MPSITILVPLANPPAWVEVTDVETNLTDTSQSIFGYHIKHIAVNSPKDSEIIIRDEANSLLHPGSETESVNIVSGILTNAMRRLDLNPKPCLKNDVGSIIYKTE